jgi:hypothetical protein
VKPNKPAEIEPQQVQSKRISSYHYKPSKRSVAALLQLLHALLQSKRISSYHYKPSKRSVAALLQLLHALLQKQANLEL